MRQVQPAVKRPRQESPAPGGSHHSQRSQDVSEVKPVDIKSDPEAGPSGSQAVNQGASAHAQQGGSEGYADDTGDFEDYGDYYGDDNGDGGAGGADGSMMGEGGEDSAGGKDFNYSQQRRSKQSRSLMNTQVCQYCFKTFKNK